MFYYLLAVNPCSNILLELDFNPTIWGYISVLGVLSTIKWLYYHRHDQNFNYTDLLVESVTVMQRNCHIAESCCCDDQTAANFTGLLLFFADFILLMSSLWVTEFPAVKPNSHRKKEKNNCTYWFSWGSSFTAAENIPYSWCLTPFHLLAMANNKAATFNILIH